GPMGGLVPQPRPAPPRAVGPGGGVGDRLLPLVLVAGVVPALAEVGWADRRSGRASLWRRPPGAAASAGPPGGPGPGARADRASAGSADQPGDAAGRPGGVPAV